MGGPPSEMHGYRETKTIVARKVRAGYLHIRRVCCCRLPLPLPLQHL